MDKRQLSEHWQERITSYRTSGLTMKKWCDANGCTMDQLKYWLYKRIKKSNKKAKQTSPALVPVTVAADPAISPLWIEVGLARIEVRPGFEPELLREVIAALR
jgi:hypothetical protein